MWKITLKYINILFTKNLGQLLIENSAAEYNIFTIGSAKYDKLP